MKKTILLAMILAHSLTAHAQGTAFIYQGRLDSNGLPYTGTAEFQASLWNAASGGSQIAANSPAQVVVGVTNGLFALPLDFGAAPFAAGAERWLQLEVRTTIGPLAPLTPRQSLTPAPYAITASNLSGTLSAQQLSGAIPSANLSGTYSGAVTFDHAANNFVGAHIGDGGSLSNVNATTLGGLGNAAFWQTGGNAGTSPGAHFVGTTDGQPLEFKVNGQRVLRIAFHPNTYEFGSPSPSLVGGHPDNEVVAQVSGATIAGGGGSNWWGATQPHRVSGHFGTIGGGVGNEVQGDVGVIAGGERGFIGLNAFNSFIGGGAWNTNLSGDATIGGGRFNSISGNAYNAFIGGGAQNTATNIYATVSGGSGNTAGGLNAAVGGGFNNAANGGYATVGGGQVNIASGNHSTVPGGSLNTASHAFTFAAGYRAKAIHQGAFVWADSQNADFTSTANDQFSVRAAGGIRLAGNVQLDTSTYRHLSLTGGNSLGYLYGSFPALADGVHLAYNHHYNAAGGSQVSNTGGATSRLTVGYGFVQLAIGGVNAAPTTQRLLANSSGVTVNGTFNNSSDRNAKQDFALVNPSQILDKVVRLPLSKWSYKDDPATRHIGPMAQDFHAAFQIGTDDKHIAPLDEGGVALAAIQGLNQKVDAESAALRAENAALRRELSEIKQLLVQLSAKGN